jgi:hypothetical protein
MLFTSCNWVCGEDGLKSLVPKAHPVLMLMLLACAASAQPVQSYPSAIVTYPSSPSFCTSYYGYTEPVFCTTPRELPLGSFAVPTSNGVYVDANFGATVRLLSGSGTDSVHQYSTPSAFSASAKYALVGTTDGRVRIIDVATSQVITSLSTEWSIASIRWSSLDDDVLYSVGGVSEPASISRYRVSTGVKTKMLDYTNDSHQFTRIDTGGTGDITPDEWIAFWAINEHQVCAVDLVSLRTYCADYTSIQLGNHVGWNFIDYVLITKGRDATTNKRYIIVMADPAAGVFSVDEANGKVDFEFRGPETPAGLMGGDSGTGNKDDVCDPGENCISTPHADVFEDQGKQYLLLTVGLDTPACEAYLVSLEISKGTRMLYPEEEGGGRKDLQKQFACGLTWSSTHMGCARSHSAYCVISMDTEAASLPGAIRNGTEPYHSEVIVMRGNGKEIRRIAMHRSVLWQYWDQPRACISSDGSLVLWDSNFGVPDSHLIVVAETGFSISSTNLALSSNTVPAGASVPLYLNLNSPAGSAIGDIEWDLGATSDAVSVISTLTASVTGSGATLLCSALRCKVSGTNGSSIPNGIIAILTASVSASSFGTIPIQLNNVVAHGQDAILIPVNASPGALFVTTPVSVTVSPSASTLAASVTQQLVATVTPTSGNIAVTWSLSPQVGSITVTGLYTAPSSIAAPSTVVVRVRSLADTSKTASATISLTSVASIIIVSPAMCSLSPSQAQAFMAGVSGASGSTAVAWSLNPPMGSISIGGVYTAPSTISTQSTVIVTAASLADNTVSAQAIITLVPWSIPAIMPVEIMGVDGTVNSISFDLPSTSAISGQLRILLQIHGLKYQSQASLKVNQGVWIPVNDSTATFQGRSAAYGGIGGGYATMKLTITLPPAAVLAGRNTVTFRFNGTDGISSGYRILGLNILASDGSQLIPSNSFVLDNPNTWQPPLNTQAHIQAGQALWSAARLNSPNFGPLRATCGSCHTQDGRDLKYFNYSNLSIEARAVFYGLTPLQGLQIASYIRALSTPAPSTARPWNPPYQPGPGLDSQPVANWAAGAGLAAVLDEDAGMTSYLTLGAMNTWLSTGYLNAREMPVAIQLPDWNRWLPIVHPIDAWGDTFEASQFNTHYQQLRSSLRLQDPVAYRNAKTAMLAWASDTGMFLDPLTKVQSDQAWNDPNYARRIYSTALWPAVKSWELNQEFGLEGMAQAVFGTPAASRAWLGNAIFTVSPDYVRMRQPNPGIGSGRSIDFIYFSQMWYQLQLILNDGNGTFSGKAPLDFKRAYDAIGALGYYSPLNPKPGHAALMTEWLLKALQVSAKGAGPDAGSQGWQLSINDPTQLFIYPTAPSIWNGFSLAQRASLLDVLIVSWYSAASQFTRAQFITGGWLDPNRTPDPTNPTAPLIGNKLAFMLPQSNYWGGALSNYDLVIPWARVLYPQFNWDTVRHAICQTSTEGRVDCPIVDIGDPPIPPH